MVENNQPLGVLFVCMGNICRSPTAEGVFREQIRESGLADAVEVDSAGTHAYHVGEPPDRRAQAVALKRGYDLSTLQARRANASDFHRFDYVIAMDGSNLKHLKRIQPGGSKAQVELLLKYGADRDLDSIPDPYYGGAKGFEFVLDLIEDAGRGLLEEIRDRV